MINIVHNNSQETTVSSILTIFPFLQFAKNCIFFSEKFYKMYVGNFVP